MIRSTLFISATKIHRVLENIRTNQLVLKVNTRSGPSATELSELDSLPKVIISTLIVILNVLVGISESAHGDHRTRADQRQNVLFIAVDDLRPNLGCYSDSLVKTPNIDQLAASGMIFRRAYCQIASCGPSRASVLTGHRPDAHMVFDNRRSFRKALPDVITLPQHFKNHGYHTRSLGKVFHGAFKVDINDDPISWSVPPWRPKAVQYLTEEGIRVLHQRYPDEYQDATRSESDVQASRLLKGLAVEAPDVADHELTDGRIAGKAIEVMRQIKDKPFFLAVGFNKPHAPFVAPKEYFDLYDPATFTIAGPDKPPARAPLQAYHDSAELRGYAGIVQAGSLPIEQARWVVHGYHACVSYVDAQVGRLIRELDRLNLREKTVIVLWGDHGYHLGHNGLWCKNTNFEAATRVPLLVSAKGMRAKGSSTEALVELVDLYPTLTKICSLPPVEGLSGTSFAPLLDDPRRRGKKVVFSQTPRPFTRPQEAMGRSIRTDRYRLVEWTGTKIKKPLYELYDYQGERPEELNLIEVPRYQPVVKQLTNLLHASWRYRGVFF